MEHKQTDFYVNVFRKWSLALAESADAWRFFPRTLVTVYGVIVFKLLDWFLHLETLKKTACTQELINTLLSKGIPLEKAQALACTVVDVVGGPTTAQTAFVTVIVGLSTAVFAFYVSSGKDWSKSIMPWNFGTTKDPESISAVKILTETKPSLPTK